MTKQELINRLIAIPFCKDFGGMDHELARQCAEIAEEYAAQFQQPAPEVKSDKYGEIEKANSIDDVCIGCKYEFTSETTIHKYCYKNLESNERFRKQ